MTDDVGVAANDVGVVANDETDVGTDVDLDVVADPGVDVDRAIEAILMVADEPQGIVGLATAVGAPVTAVVHSQPAKRSLSLCLCRPAKRSARSA